MKIRKYSPVPVLVAIVCMSATMAAQSAEPVIPADKAGLLKGEGMGMAMPAERNGFPGPKHVLEFREQLRLNREQSKRIEELARNVEVAAQVKGEEIVTAELAVEKIFASPKVQEKALRAALERVGKLRSDLRFIHLQAHLSTAKVLTPEQIATYRELRAKKN